MAVANPPAAPTPTPSAPAKLEQLAPTATVSPEAATNPVGGDDALLEASFSKPKTPEKAAVVDPNLANPTDKKPEDKKVDDKAPTKADAKPEDKKEDKKPDAAKPADAPAEHFASNKEMRQELDRRKQAIAAKDSEVSRLTGELTSLRQKVDELSKNGNGDSKVLSEQIASRDKRIEELQARLSGYDFRNSPEYEQQFTQKWDRAAKRALADVSKLRITDADGNPTDQPATTAHLERLLTMDPVTALDQAEAWFGKRAPVAMQHYTQLKALQDESEAAVQQHQATHNEKTGAEKARQAQESQFAQEAYGRITSELMANREDLFKPAADDAEHAELIEAATRSIDSSLANRSKMPIDKRVKLDAMIRTAAISQLISDKLRERDRVKIKAGEDRIAELEATILELRGSGPGPAKDLGGDATTGGTSDAELDEMGKKAFSK